MVEKCVYVVLHEHRTVAYAEALHHRDALQKAVIVTGLPGDELLAIPSDEAGIAEYRRHAGPDGIAVVPGRDG